MLTLKAETRDIKNKPETLRKKGKIPAVFYGAKNESTPILIDAVKFKKIWQEAGESTIVSLDTDKGDLGTLIQEVQMDPVKDEPVHVDFYVVDKDKTIEVEVPLEFVGVSPAVKDLGGILVKVLHTLTIEALPKDLPHEINIDISVLTEINSHISAESVPLPTGVKLKTRATETVALISEAAKEEEEKPPEAIDMTAIEVEKRGKEETEEGTEGGEGEKKEKKE